MSRPSNGYDSLKHNAQIANPIQYSVRPIKRSDGTSNLLLI